MAAAQGMLSFRVVETNQVVRLNSELPGVCDLSLKCAAVVRTPFPSSIVAKLDVLGGTKYANDRVDPCTLLRVNVRGANALFGTHKMLYAESSGASGGDMPGICIPVGERTDTLYTPSNLDLLRAQEDGAVKEFTANIQYLTSGGGLPASAYDELLQHYAGQPELAAVTSRVDLALSQNALFLHDLLKLKFPTADIALIPGVIKSVFLTFAYAGASTL